MRAARGGSFGIRFKNQGRHRVLLHGGAYIRAGFFGLLFGCVCRMVRHVVPQTARLFGRNRRKMRRALVRLRVGTEHTDAILAALDREGVTATWFMVQFWTEKYPEYVKKIHNSLFFPSMGWLIASIIPGCR